MLRVRFFNHETLFQRFSHLLSGITKNDNRECVSYCLAWSAWKKYNLPTSGVYVGKWWNLEKKKLCIAFR